MKPHDQNTQPATETPADDKNATSGQPEGNNDALTHAYHDVLEARHEAEAPTPEVDAFILSAPANFITRKMWSDFARRLERERDEWRAEARSLAIQLNHFHTAEDTAIEVGKERDQWREVAERLAATSSTYGPSPALATFYKLKEQSK